MMSRVEKLLRNVQRLCFGTLWEDLEWRVLKCFGIAAVYFSLWMFASQEQMGDRLGYVWHSDVLKWLGRIVKGFMSLHLFHLFWLCILWRLVKQQGFEDHLKTAERQTHVTPLHNKGLNITICSSYFSQIGEDLCDTSRSSPLYRVNTWEWLKWASHLFFRCTRQISVIWACLQLAVPCSFKKEWHFKETGRQM